MNILMVSQHYWPESFINTDICESLAARGHSVTVLTGLPNYPEGTIPDEYKRGRRRVEERCGVQIIRVPIIARGMGLRGFSGLRRAANYVSFWMSGTVAAKKLGSKYDVVLSCQTSPVTMAAPAIAYAKRYGTGALIYCCDLAPEDLLVGGFSKQSIAYRVYGSIAERVYGSADMIAVSSPKFADYLSTVVRVPRDRIVWLPQFAEDCFRDCAPSRQLSADDAPDWCDDVLHFLFAGNVGSFQAVETIVRAASRMPESPPTKFHIVGGGSHLESCKSLMRELGVRNVVFHGRQPLESMPDYYSRADALLLTMRRSECDAVVQYTLPRKLQTYLAAGKPVIASASGEVSRVLMDSGGALCCEPEDPQAFVRILAEFAAMTQESRDEKGARARVYYEKNFSKSRFLESLESHLSRISNQR